MHSECPVPEEESADAQSIGNRDALRASLTPEDPTTPYAPTGCPQTHATPRVRCKQAFYEGHTNRAQGRGPIGFPCLQLSTRGARKARAAKSTTPSARLGVGESSGPFRFSYQIACRVDEQDDVIGIGIPPIIAVSAASSFIEAIAFSASSLACPDSASLCS